MSNRRPCIIVDVDGTLADASQQLPFAPAQLISETPTSSQASIGSRTAPITR